MLITIVTFQIMIINAQEQWFPNSGSRPKIESRMFL